MFLLITLCLHPVSKSNKLIFLIKLDSGKIVPTVPVWGDWRVDCLSPEKKNCNRWIWATANIQPLYPDSLQPTGLAYRACRGHKEQERDYPPGQQTGKEWKNRRKCHSTNQVSKRPPQKALKNLQISCQSLFFPTTPHPLISEKTAFHKMFPNTGYRTPY